jgi:hypothetical protein
MSLGVLLDPLGAESIVSLGVLYMLVLDIAVAEKPLAPWQFAAAAGWIALQEPTLTLAFAVGLIVVGLSRYDGRYSIVGVMCVVVFAIRTALELSATHALDPYSAQAAIIALGLFAFVLTPVMVYLLVTLRPVEHAGRMWGLYTIAGILFAAPLLPGATDVAVSWSAASFAIVFTFAPSLQSQNRVAANIAFIGIAVVAALIQLPLARNVALAPRWNREAKNITPILSSLTGRACVTGGLLGSDQRIAQEYRRIYAPGIASITSANDPTECALSNQRGSLITVDPQAGVTDWKEGGLALVSASVRAKTGEPLALDSGSVTPRSQHPGQRSAFTTNLDTPLGKQRALTVVAGYTYRLHCVDLRRGLLSFAVANPIANLPSAQPVRYEVAVQSKGAKPHVIRAGILNPTPGETATRWQHILTELPRGSSCDDLVFSAAAPNGRAIATWATFVAPVISR